MKFTVIIPTRERAATLQHSLATVVAQDYADLTILVSDNASTDNTRAVVESFKDSRIRYVNTGQRLEMSANWEFALRHVQDGFVCYLGDDDGLLPGAVSTAAKLIGYFGLPGVVWSAVTYGWPDHPLSCFRNALSIPFAPLVIRRNAKQALQGFENGDHYYPKLLGVYQTAFVDVSIIRRCQSRWSDGRFFRCSQPDVYAALVLTKEVDAFPFSFAPLSIAGASGRSNAASAATSLHSCQPFAGETQCFLSELQNFKLTSRIEHCSSFAFFWADALLAAAERPDGSIADERNLIRKSLFWIVRDIANGSRKDYDEGVAAIRKTAIRYGLSGWAEKLILDWPHQPKALCEAAFHASGLNCIEHNLQLNAADFGVQNVADAAQCVTRLLGYSHGQSLTLECGGALREFLMRACRWGLRNGVQRGLRITIENGTGRALLKSLPAA